MQCPAVHISDHVGSANPTLRASQCDHSNMEHGTHSYSLMGAVYSPPDTMSMSYNRR